MKYIPDLPAFLALAQKHGLSAEQAENLPEFLEGVGVSRFVNAGAYDFGELIPWTPGEKSRWFQHSDRAAALQDAFLAEWASDPATVERLCLVKDESPRWASHAPIAELMEDAMWRGFPLTAKRVGEIVETQSPARVDFYVNSFMDFFYRKGMPHNRESHAREFEPWRILWAAMGPRARASAARSECWSGFFESPAGKVSGSCLITDDMGNLATLAEALDVCAEPRSMILAKLSDPSTHAALSQALALRDAQASANNWAEQGVAVSKTLDSLSRWVGWGASQREALRAAVKAQSGKAGGNWRETPRLNAWLEAHDLRDALASQNAESALTDSKASPRL
jgi:hypothetical protein